MNAHNLITTALIVTCALSTGCQSWQGSQFALPNTTRVPPPGTGTYQLPTGYYNNATSALSPNQTMQTADLSSGLRTATGSFPTTNMPPTDLVSSANFVQASMVQTPVARAPNNQAQFSSNISPVVSASHSQFSDGSTITASGATLMSDSQAAEAPSLQWQQFGDQ